MFPMLQKFEGTFGLNRVPKVPEKPPSKPPSNLLPVLLMEEILHQMIGRLSNWLQGFIHPRWCRISSIDSTFTVWSPPSPVKRGMGQKWHPSTPLEDCSPTSREWPWGGDVVIRSLPTHRLYRNSLFKDQNEKYWKIFSNKNASCLLRLVVVFYTFSLKGSRFLLLQNPPGCLSQTIDSALALYRGPRISVYCCGPWCWWIAMILSGSTNGLVFQPSIFQPSIFQV